MTTISLTRRRLATALACAAATALVARPASAQWGKIKDLGKAAAKGAVEGTVEGAAKKAVGNGGAQGAPIRPSNVKFTGEVLEITDARVAQLLRGLDAEAAAKPEAERKYLAQVATAEAEQRAFPAREAAWEREYAAWQKRQEAHNRCTDGVQAKHKGTSDKLQADGEAMKQRVEQDAKATFTDERKARIKAMAERAQAAQARGDQKTALAIGDSLRGVVDDIMRIGSHATDFNARVTALGREAEADTKKCGVLAPEPERPNAPALANPEEARQAVKAAGVKASGLEERQYDVLRERVETYVRLGGRGGTRYIFSAGELETLAKHADALGKRADISEEQYWTPGEKASR